MLGSRGRRPKNGEGGKKNRNQTQGIEITTRCHAENAVAERDISSDAGETLNVHHSARAEKARLCARIIMCPAIAMRNLMYARKTRIRAEIGDRREGKLQLQRESRNFAIRAKHVVPLPRISVPTAFRHILCRTDTVRGSPHYRDSLEERRNRKHEGN